MLTCLVSVSILSILTTVDMLSTVSVVDKDTAGRLDLTVSPAQRADLDAARRDFPGYQIEVEPTPGRCRYIARRTQPGPGPHTLITSDLAELCTELRPVQQFVIDPDQAGTDEGR